METLVRHVSKEYKRHKNLHVSIHTEPLTPHIPALTREINDNPYVLPEVRAFLADASSYITVFRASTIELRVIGCTPRDHWICQRVCRRAVTVQAVFPTTPETIVIWVFLSNAKRLMPSQGPITPEHINGGYTYLKGFEIYVLRREEFPKVVIHELIHHTKHHCHDWSDHCLRELYDVFYISKHKCSVTTMDTCSTSLQPNEAVVETWAEILHMIFVTIDYDIPFQQMYHAELNHAFQRTKQILAHQHTQVPEWREETHAYSYIVVRTLLLATFTSWAMTTPHNTDMLTAHIIKTWLNPVIQAQIRGAKPTNKSLRMTLFGDL